ncbi:MAG: slipin family protein, partial [Bacteroidales bacterium]
MKTKNLFNSVSITVLVVVSALLAVLLYVNYLDIKLFVVLLILTILISSSIKIADQWEKAVLLRMGKYIGLKGPGIFFIVPIIDNVIDYIDQR